MSHLTKNTPIGSLLRYFDSASDGTQYIIVTQLTGFVHFLNNDVASAKLLCLFVNYNSSVWKIGDIKEVSIPHGAWEVIKGVRPD